jgi:hypothetical protein
MVIVPPGVKRATRTDWPFIPELGSPPARLADPGGRR